MPVPKSRSLSVYGAPKPPCGPRSAARAFPASDQNAVMRPSAPAATSTSRPVYSSCTGPNVPRAPSRIAAAPARTSAASPFAVTPSASTEGLVTDAPTTSTGVHVPSASRRTTRPPRLVAHASVTFPAASEPASGSSSGPSVCSSVRAAPKPAAVPSEARMYLTPPYPFSSMSAQITTTTPPAPTATAGRPRSEAIRLSSTAGPNAPPGGRTEASTRVASPSSAVHATAIVPSAPTATAGRDVTAARGESSAGVLQDCARAPSTPRPKQARTTTKRTKNRPRFTLTQCPSQAHLKPSALARHPTPMGSRRSS